ncbi:MAG: hypothetical protein M1817_003226 [Caeruleum heppii]|nr:MAG: hypothetical protein M1817_003226 [Caeruleum heppii]
MGVMLLRRATAADVEAITDIAQAAMPDDPQWDYRFPYRDRYPEDNRRWTRQFYQDFFDEPAKFATWVMTVPDAAGQRDPGKPVAFAVWVVENLQQGFQTAQPFEHPREGREERRDANPEHMQAFLDAIDEAMHEYFDRLGTSQIDLHVLATHPDYRRRGAATTLCKWGMKEAKGRDMSVTVIGSPMGTPLYVQLGFVELGHAIAQVQGEDQKLILHACLYN